MEWIKDNWILVLLLTTCWIYWTIVKAQTGANASPKDYAEEQRKHQERVSQAKSQNSNGDTEGGNAETPQESTSGSNYQMGAWGSNQPAPTQADSRVTYTDTMASEETQSTSLDAHQHEEQQQQVIAEENARF